MNTIITTDYYGNKYEVRPENLAVSIHVYGIAMQDDKLLILPQHDGYGWPGGTFKLGEDTVQTLQREFKEETGFDIEPVKLLDIETNLFHNPRSNRDYHSISIFYLVKVVGGKLSDNGFGANEREYAKLAKWIAFSDLRKMHYAFSIDIADKLLDLVQEENTPSLQ